MTEGFIEDLLRWQREIDALPPRPSRFRASHAVPFDRLYRQWNTRGELEIWVNRGLIHDLPRTHKEDPAIIVHGLANIPVYLE